MYLADIFTVPANLAGICGLSLPCGFAESDDGTRLPVGLQLLGASLDEARLLQIALRLRAKHGVAQAAAAALRSA